MKPSHRLILLFLAAQMVAPSSRAQPITLQPNGILSLQANSINNVRVVKQTSDGTEVILAMDYSYDGFGGPSATLIPVVEKRDQKGVSAWFGADPLTIGVGRGPISIDRKSVV